MPMAVPERIGRHRVVRLLGSGAFAVVWLAHDELLDLPVAVKVLADNWAHRADVRERFLEEARVLRHTDSDHVVRVHDLGELPDGRPYFVMTYADGGSLADLLSDGPLPVERAAHYALGVARGLEALHRAGVIHRDVTPANVLLATGADGSERVLIADLGLAKALAQASGFTLASGTTGYASPEQLRPGGGLDVRADVYGLGALSYALLTGSPPGVGRRLAPPSQLNPQVPRSVDAVVLRALSLERDRRPGSIAQFADELTVAMGGRRARRHAPLLGAAVAAVLAAGGAAVWLTTADPGTVRLVDSSGTLHVAVPERFAGEIQDDGWPLAPYGGQGRGPALAVAADIEQWRRSQSDLPGLFVGTGEDLRVRRLRAVGSHPDCGPPDVQRVRAAGLPGTRERWGQCPGGGTWDEVVLGPDTTGQVVYVQVRNAADAEVTEMLDSLRVGTAS